jgi:hypothetical protein
VTETATFVCSICSESSTDICVYCTKDTCANHRCIRCRRCSDCCECEAPLTAAEAVREPAVTAAVLPPPQPVVGEPEPSAEAEPQPELTAEEIVQSLPELFAPDAPARSEEGEAGGGLGGTSPPLREE